MASSPLTVPRVSTRCPAAEPLAEGGAAALASCRPAEAAGGEVRFGPLGTLRWAAAQGREAGAVRQARAAAAVAGRPWADIVVDASARGGALPRLAALRCGVGEGGGGPGAAPPRPQRCRAVIIMYDAPQPGRRHLPAARPRALSAASPPPWPWLARPDSQVPLHPPPPPSRPKVIQPLPAAPPPAMNQGQMHHECCRTLTATQDRLGLPLIVYEGCQFHLPSVLLLPRSWLSSSTFWKDVGWAYSC